MLKHASYFITEVIVDVVTDFAFTGSMVSFGMRLLHAELPHHLGRSQETLDRFYYILAITKKVMLKKEMLLFEHLTSFSDNFLTLQA